MYNIDCLNCDKKIHISDSYNKVTCSKKCHDDISILKNDYSLVFSFNIIDIDKIKSYIDSWNNNNMINPENNKKIGLTHVNIRKRCETIYSNYNKILNIYDIFANDKDYLEKCKHIYEQYDVTIKNNTKLLDEYKNSDEYLRKMETEFNNNILYFINDDYECFCKKCKNRCICYQTEEHYMCSHCFPCKCGPSRTDYHYNVLCKQCEWNKILDSRYNKSIATMINNICNFCATIVSGCVDKSYVINGYIYHLSCYRKFTKPENPELYIYNEKEHIWIKILLCDYCKMECHNDKKIKYNDIMYHYNCYESNIKPNHDIYYKYSYDQISSYEYLCVETKMTEEEIKIKKKEIKTKNNEITNQIISQNIEFKRKILKLKFTYGKKYKGYCIVDILYKDTSYIQWLIAHNCELDTYTEFNSYGQTRGKKIVKTKKVESDVTKIFRYILGIPKYPCDVSGCCNYAMFGETNNLPYKCIDHKKNIHKIVLQTACRGVDGVCPYGCKNGNINYDNFCTYCFMHLFPADPRTKNIRSKTKEIQVVNHISLTHGGEWYHDIPLYVNFEDGCCPTRRRIDLRQMIGNTMLCIEIDENQHKYYTKDDDFVRYNEILCDLTCKYIFIRYNPDKYKMNGKIVDLQFAQRMILLDQTIRNKIERINNNENTDLLEIVHLFYDE